APRKPGADLEKQLAEVNASNAKVSIGNEQGDRLRDRGPRQGTVDEPAIADPSLARADGDKGEKVPATRIDVRPQPPKTPGVDTDAIVAKIRTTYMGAMQRCYKKALSGEPTLSGKVSLLFTLSEKGAVSDPEARGVSEVFEECLEGVMPRWTFTPVVDEDGDAVELDIGVTLQLSI
ncbi:MAG: AgmX/PglI C-terminal domain-containing protein, partial [Deltaproteobacteria bacterium]|nr:AgmX/PglI C-terminal domain-containing protein [Kofleriaceae bacterium]